MDSRLILFIVGTVPGGGGSLASERMDVMLEFLNEIPSLVWVIVAVLALLVVMLPLNSPSKEFGRGGFAMLFIFLLGGILAVVIVLNSPTARGWLGLGLKRDDSKVVAVVTHSHSGPKVLTLSKAPVFKVEKDADKIRVTVIGLPPDHTIVAHWDSKTSASTPKIGDNMGKDDSFELASDATNIRVQIWNETSGEITRPYPVPSGKKGGI